MPITQTVDIPVNRRITLEVPREITTEKTNIVFFPVHEETLAQKSFAESMRRYAKEQIRKAEIDIPMERRGRGCLKGEIWMADDFNEPLEDFKDYM